MTSWNDDSYFDPLNLEVGRFDLDLGRFDLDLGRFDLDLGCR